MKSTCLSLRGAALALGLLAGGAASAQTLNLFFTETGSTTAIDRLVIGTPNSSFTFSVWARTSANVDHDLANVFLAYDRTATEGTGAAPIDNEVSFTSVGNVHANYESPASTSTFGLWGSGDRPFGVEASLFTPVGTTVGSGTAAFRLFDITFRNEGLAAGQTWTLSALNSRPDGQDTVALSYLFGPPDSTLAAAADARLTVEAVPEPGTLAALAAGLVALGARRRRASR